MVEQSRAFEFGCGRAFDATDTEGLRSLGFVSELKLKTGWQQQM